MNQLSPEELVIVEFLSQKLHENQPTLSKKKRTNHGLDQLCDASNKKPRSTQLNNYSTTNLPNVNVNINEKPRSTQLNSHPTTNLPNVNINEKPRSTQLNSYPTTNLPNVNVNEKPRSTQLNSYPTTN